MNRWTRVGAAAVLLAALLAVGATGSFSAVEADRGVSVAVADDEHAYLGVETDVEGCNATVTVTNRFATSVSTVSLEAGNDSATIDGLEPGEVERRELRLDAAADSHEIYVAATGTDVRVATTEDLDSPRC